MLRTVTSGDGAGPVLEEGIAVAFARASRAGDGRASANQISDMETAFSLAGHPEFRLESSEFAKFQIAVTESIEKGNVWPVLEGDPGARETISPSAVPASSAAPSAPASPVPSAAASPAASAAATQPSAATAPVEPEVKRSRFRDAAEAAQDTGEAPRATRTEGRGSGSGRAAVRDSWMGKSLNRQDESKPLVRQRATRWPNGG